MSDLIAFIKRLFTKRPVHFHTAECVLGGMVCGTRGGECVLSRDYLPNVTCPGCLAWIAANPGHLYYANTHDWLFGVRTAPDQGGAI